MSAVAEFGLAFAEVLLELGPLFWGDIAALVLGTRGLAVIQVFRSAVRTVQPQDEMGVPVAGGASTGFRIPGC
ncbi:hypothetical protein ABZ876_35155 [Streptomyces sp. NPDC046931]|uniref:hypothetical protein n=1 Tax=Streptomyces sp. NPDC046931 TaxID=3154806 RepID=UPI0033C0EB10